jgi:hypothetical protein
MAATMTSANTNIEQLGLAMSYAAPIAADMGISIEETAAAIGRLSDAGIQGERAGTALRGIMLTLSAPTAKTRNAMEDLGITVSDAQGEFLPLADIVGQFETRLDGMTDAQRSAALGTVFTTEQIGAFNVLLAEGSDDLASYTDELEGAGGSAERLAGQQMATFQGAMTELRSAVEGVAIEVGQELLPVMTELTRDVLIPFVRTYGPMLVDLTNDFANGLTPVVRGLQVVIQNTERAITPISDLADEAQAVTAGMQAFTEAQTAYQQASEETQAAFADEGGALRALQQEHRAAVERVVDLRMQMANNPLGFMLEDDLQEALTQANALGSELESESQRVAAAITANNEAVIASQERTAEQTAEQADAQAEAMETAAIRMETAAIRTAVASGDTAEAMRLLEESAYQTEDGIKAATRALEQMGNVEQDIIATQQDLTDIDAEYAQTRKDTLQDLADAEENYQQRLASIAADESGAIQDAYEERNEAIADTQRELGETLADISADTNRKLADMAEEGARQEAEARRRVEQRIAGTLADTRVSAETNDLAAVGAAPEDRAGIEQRERTEARRLEALQAAQQEALRWTQQGEAELAGEQFAIRERGIEDRLALEESYEENRQRLIEQGRSDLIGELDRERDEALQSIQEREDLAINIVHEAAQQRQRQRQEERQAIIEEGNIRKAAAREAAQAQIAAAEQAAQRQIQAAQESAAIQRQEAQARIQEERQELAQQAQQELESYEARRQQLETKLGEQLAAYGEYYGQALSLNEQQQQALTDSLREAYNIQEQELNESLQRRLDATRAFVEEQGNIGGQAPQVEPGTGNVATTTLQVAGARARGGPVGASALYEVTEPGVGPELLTFGGRQYLMTPPTGTGEVSPLGSPRVAMPNTSTTNTSTFAPVVNLNITTSGDMGATTQQIAAAIENTVIDSLLSGWNRAESSR